MQGPGAETYHIKYVEGYLQVLEYAGPGEGGPHPPQTSRHESCMSDRALFAEELC